MDTSGSGDPGVCRAERDVQVEPVYVSIPSSMNIVMTGPCKRMLGCFRQSCVGV